jgi:hypothetical protein
MTATLVGLFIAAAAIADGVGTPMPRTIPTRVESGVVAASPRDCKPGLYRQPRGPFATLLFCEDAQGSYIGVIYLDNAGSAKDGWPLASRFWQEPEWASDVTAFAWSDDRQSLFVSTQGVYGAVGVFRLKLPERRAIRLFPTESLASGLFQVGETCSAEIKSVKSTDHALVIEVTNCLESETRTLRIPDSAG